MAAKRKTTKRKPAPRKKTVVEKAEVMEMKKETPMSKPKFSKKYMLFIVLLIIAGLAYLFRGQYLAAMVNGYPVSRLKVLGELENQGGAQVLDGLITDILITQEASNNNINITDDQVTAEISKIESELTAQGQTLDDLLAYQGFNREVLAKKVKSQLALEALLADKTTYTDEELASYIDQNSAQMPEDLTEDQMKQVAGEQLKQVKFQTEAQSFLTDLKTKANVTYFGNYATATTTP